MPQNRVSYDKDKQCPNYYQISSKEFVVCGLWSGQNIRLLEKYSLMNLKNTL